MPFYEIVNDSSVTVGKFNTTKRRVIFKIKDKKFDDNEDQIVFFKNVINQIIIYTLSQVLPTDKIGITFELGDFKEKPPGFLTFRRASNVSFNDVWNILESILQSDPEALSSNNFRLIVTSVRSPVGKGRQRNYNNFEEECRQRRGIITINNRDNLCLPRALVVGKAYANKDPNYNKIRKSQGLQKERAEDLMKKAGAETPPNQGWGVDELRLFQSYLSDYKITVYRFGTKGRELLFEGPVANKKINLLYHENHYNLISSLTSAFACIYYCEGCHIPYNNKERHRCGATCPCCQSEPPCEKVVEEIVCNDCERSFRGITCFTNHKQINKNESVCASIRKCKDCLKTFNLINRKSPHVCGEIYCKQCQDHKPENHFCFIRPAQPRKDKEETLFVFYDLETRQEKEDSQDPNIKIHEVHLCVFSQVCPNCYNSDASICSYCGVREQTLRGLASVERFLEYLLGVRKIFKRVVVIAHNAQGFDAQFILNYVLTRTSVKPELIMRGSKILMMGIQNLKFIDSLNYFPMALSALPKAFGLSENIKKGYFPHLFNTETNANYVGPLPDIKYYASDSMKPEVRAEFLKWYEEHKNDVFDMQSDLVDYCRSDVDILKRACMQFRDIFLKECYVDPFTESITIASACNLMFRRKFLQSDTIGIIPTGGYRRVDNHSAVAIQWLVWEGDVRGIRIKHAGKEREMIINGMKVDGYCEETKQVFEFQGCYYHGCPTCFLTRRNESLHDDPKDTMDQRYEITKNKTARLRSQGYEVIEMWECKFKKELSCNAEMQYLKNHPMLKYIPLNPRDAFYGGRTGCTKLKYAAKPGEKIKYVDVCSLYPWVCKYGEFPVGHPKVYVGHECKILIDEKGLGNIKGVIKCSVLPPQNLYHPVLPVKKHNKLMFPLCNQCVDNLNEGECLHTPVERTLCGTWCSDELVKAVEKGYRLIEIQELWSYETTQFSKSTQLGGLFAGFINKFLKMKQQASGWPPNCKEQEEKIKYVEEFRKSEGVQLEFLEVIKNPGLRSLAKLMLNSFWGKFGQRENQPKTSIINDPKEFFDLLSNPSTNVNYIQEVNEEVIVVNWAYKEEAADPLFTVNCVIAAYVTTQARLKLYTYLDLLGERVLYYDTDSVIYISRGEELDLPLGNLLGDLTDEIEPEYGPGSYIKEFASGGPKTYGYRVLLPNLSFKTKIKVKGITLNHKNSEKVNLDTLVSLIDELDEHIVTSTSAIRITGDHLLVTKQEDKVFRININKRRRIEDYDTLPYGYKINKIK